MPAMLNQANNRGWPAFEGLLRGMLRFLEPYLRNAQLTVSVRNLYKVRPVRSRGRKNGISNDRVFGSGL